MDAKIGVQQFLHEYEPHMLQSALTEGARDAVYATVSYLRSAGRDQSRTRKAWLVEVDRWKRVSSKVIDRKTVNLDEYLSRNARALQKRFPIAAKGDILGDAVLSVQESSHMQGYPLRTSEEWLSEISAAVAAEGNTDIKVRKGATSAGRGYEASRQKHQSPEERVHESRTLDRIPKLLDYLYDEHLSDVDRDILVLTYIRPLTEVAEQDKHVSEAFRADIRRWEDEARRSFLEVVSAPSETANKKGRYLLSKAMSESKNTSPEDTYASALIVRWFELRFPGIRSEWSGLDPSVRKELLDRMIHVRNIAPPGVAERLSEAYRKETRAAVLRHSNARLQRLIDNTLKNYTQGRGAPLKPLRSESSYWDAGEKVPVDLPPGYEEQQLLKIFPRVARVLYMHTPKMLKLFPQRGVRPSTQSSKDGSSPRIEGPRAPRGEV